MTTKNIEKALSRAVKDIVSHPETTDEGTGTTLTGLYLETQTDEPHWVTLNIGDSRVYLLRDDEIVQVTTDHSVVQELIAAGRLSPEEAENHPYGNVITRAVGPSDSVKPDYLRLDVLDGDRSSSAPTASPKSSPTSASVTSSRPTRTPPRPSRR